MRIAIIAPGLHRICRGAEIALEAVGHELGRMDGVEVTLIGSGVVKHETSYQFKHVSNLPREWFEKWPRGPLLRNEYAYEELTFLVGLMCHYLPEQYDITMACNYPFVNWWLRRGHRRPAHIYVTQNGDYPARANHREFAWFGCDGLVCTNPEYYERNQDRWFSSLITNGVDSSYFSPKPCDRSAFNLPEDVPIVLMVSALIPSKRVADGIQGTANIEGLHLVVCGDGPERNMIDTLGQELMPGRFHRLTLDHSQMPDLYRAADVLLHLSLDEPFGNVYLEALATGLPIVTHDRTVTRWLLEDTSILVDTTNLVNIATALRDALEQNSPGQIAQRCSLVQRRFAWSLIGHQYYAFFEAVLEHSRANR